MRVCGKLMNNGMETLNLFDKKYNVLHLLFSFYLGVYMSMGMFLCTCMHMCVFVSVSVCQRTMRSSHFSPTSYRLLVFNSDLQVGFCSVFQSYQVWKIVSGKRKLLNKYSLNEYCEGNLFVFLHDIIQVICLCILGLIKEKI